MRILILTANLMLICASLVFGVPPLNVSTDGSGNSTMTMFGDIYMTKPGTHLVLADGTTVYANSRASNTGYLWLSPNSYFKYASDIVYLYINEAIVAQWQHFKRSGYVYWQGRQVYFNNQKVRYTQ